MTSAAGLPLTICSQVKKAWPVVQWFSRRVGAGAAGEGMLGVDAPCAVVERRGARKGQMGWVAGVAAQRGERAEEGAWRDCRESAGVRVKRTA